jgi:hypothetical protein
MSNTTQKSTPRIKNWLFADNTRVWKQLVDNPNCFKSNLGEALYVYEDSVKYWEDIRDQNLFIECKIPQTKSELNTIIL